jgi:hypothetical protein
MKKQYLQYCEDYSQKCSRFLSLIWIDVEEKIMPRMIKTLIKAKYNLKLEKQRSIAKSRLLRMKVTMLALEPNTPRKHKGVLIGDQVLSKL